MAVSRRLRLTAALILLAPLCAACTSGPFGKPRNADDNLPRIKYDGISKVGKEIQEGMYKVEFGAFPECSWVITRRDKRLEKGSIGAGDAGLVNLEKGDVFSTANCGEWEQIMP